MSFRIKRFAADILALVLLVYLMGQFGGCKSTLSPLGYGYLAVSQIAKARDATAAGIEGYCKPLLNECTAKHPGDLAALKKCLVKCPQAVKSWHTIVYPVVQASIEATLGALDAARAKEQSNWNWIKSALPALCGLLAAVHELKPILGDKAEKILGYLELGRKYVCP